MSKPAPEDRIGFESRPRSLSEEIVAVLEQAILTGVYAPGQRLVERDLTTQFGVSSIPVREALQELENRGLVTKKHNYGSSVVQLSPDEAEQICNLRRALEPDVVRWAVERITAEHIAELETIWNRMAAASDANDLPAFFYADVQFHKKIWAISGNRFAARALETAMGPLFAAGLNTAKAGRKPNLLDEAKKHKRLLTAIATKDSNDAIQSLLAIASVFEKNFRR